MIQIRKPSGIIPKRTLEKIKKGETVSSETGSEAASSPFAARPADALKAITERKSRGLTEEQRLALLQKALEPFANEARSHLPTPIGQLERKVRKRMLEEGFGKEVASEAGDETVTVLLDKVVSKKEKSA